MAPAWRRIVVLSSQCEGRQKPETKRVYKQLAWVRLTKVNGGRSKNFAGVKPLAVSFVCDADRFGEGISMMMKKALTAGLAVAVLGAVSIGAGAPAQAREGGAIAAGVIGGLALGAIAGSAAAGPGYGYGYAPPAYAPAYAAPAYGGCYLTRQATYDPYGNFAGYRRVRVCE